MEYQATSDICIIKKRDNTPQSAVIETLYGVDDKIWYGDVLQVGPGKRNKKTGKRMPMTVQAGDVVAIGSYTGERHFMLDGEVGDLVALRETDVIAICEEGNEEAH